MAEEPYYDAQSKPSRGVAQHVKSGATWLRLAFMILFALISSVVRLVIGIVVFVQFLHVLFAGETNRKLLDFGHALAAYIYEITAYLTYNTEVRPFPFDAPWPPPAPPVLHPPVPKPPPAPPPSSASPSSSPSSPSSGSPSPSPPPSAGSSSASQPSSSSGDPPL